MTATIAAFSTTAGILLGFFLSWGIQEHVVKTQILKAASLADAYYMKQAECGQGLLRRAKR